MVAIAMHGGYATDVDDVYNHTLLPAHEVAEFYRYPHVKSGYRAHNASWRDCIRSLFYAHNQQWNAWTMIVMVPLAVLYMILMLTVATTPVQPVVAALFLLQYMLVCPASAVYHMAQAMGLEQAKLLLRLDCCMQMVAAILAQYIMAFYVMNDESTVRALLSTISISVTLFYGLVLLAAPDFDTMSSSRLLMLLAPAIQASLVFTPIVYSEVLNGFAQCGLWAELLIINMILGAVLWILHFPERYWPYKLDTSVHSHVVMHLALVVFQLLQAGYLWSAAAEYGGDALTHDV